MDETESFRDLIGRVRAGDGDAATELVRRYEPMVRRAARVRLTDPRIGRLLESMDICQSVMASFFVRAALGQYELDTPDQLLRLLATMARNKLTNQARGQRAARRDTRRVDHGAFEVTEVAAREGSPSRVAAGRELLEAARARLSPEEQRLLDLRQDGVNWESVAAEFGGTPESCRKKLARAVDRVARELGLDDPDDGRA